MRYEERLIVGTYNILLITLDSSRYDTAVSARMPFLNSVATLRRAETTATFTLPSHISLFSGALPLLVDGNHEYLPGIKQIWRSANARRVGGLIGTIFTGKTIMEYYRRNGYQVIGAGGVSFFARSEDNILPQLFPDFIHFEGARARNGLRALPRAQSAFPLANISRIIRRLDLDRPFFLFVNSPETHIPYDCPGMLIT